MKNVLTRKLQLFGRLCEADRELLDQIIKSPFWVASNQDLIRQGAVTENVHVILSGLACQNQILPDGRRQITAFLLPGDFCDLQAFTLKRLDYNISNLSQAAFAQVPKEEVLRLFQRPSLERVLSLTTLVDGEVLRAALVNVATRSAERRIAHLFCELHMRMLAVGLVQGQSFELPVTQMDISDAVGISTVHTNRVIQRLRKKGLILVRQKSVTIIDVDLLRDLAAFNANYLHFNLSGRDEAGAKT